MPFQPLPPETPFGDPGARNPQLFHDLYGVLAAGIVFRVHVGCRGGTEAGELLHAVPVPFTPQLKRIRRSPEWRVCRSRTAARAALRPPTAGKSDPPVLRAGLPTTPFGCGDRRGVRSLFPSVRRYPVCRAEKAGAARIDCYRNARSRPTGIRTPFPTWPAAVAGIQAEALVRSPRAGLVPAGRRGCG
jgi:hypothetical protein